MSKKNIMKDLKRMKLIPTRKQYEQLMVVGAICLLVLLTAFAMWGAIKYPIPDHYYDNMNYPANHYSNLATFDDIPECGNDPYFELPWKRSVKYHDYV